MLLTIRGVLSTITLGMYVNNQHVVLYLNVIFSLLSQFSLMLPLSYTRLCIPCRQLGL